MGKKKSNQTPLNEETIQEFMEATNSTSYNDSQYETTSDTSPVSMNNIARAAFLEYRKAGIITDKEIDDYTIREYKADNLKLKEIMLNSLSEDKFSEKANNTLMMTSLVAAYLNEVDLNKYYKFNI